MFSENGEKLKDDDVHPSVAIVSFYNFYFFFNIYVRQIWANLAAIYF